MPSQRTTRLPLPPALSVPGTHVVAQFVKFGIVGVSNTLLSLLIYTALLKGLGLWYLAASAISFAAGAVNGFLLNRRWTFRDHQGDSLTAVRWAVVQGCGLLANLAIVYALVDGAGLDKLLGQALSIAVITVLTFIANRAWTFRMTHPPAAPAELWVTEGGEGPPERAPRSVAQR